MSLSSHLYIVVQDRETDVDTFSQHENNPYPPSLSDREKLQEIRFAEMPLIQAPDKDTLGSFESIETHDVDDDTDLAAFLQHVAKAESSV